MRYYFPFFMSGVSSCWSITEGNLFLCFMIALGAYYIIDTNRDASIFYYASSQHYDAVQLVMRQDVM